jgi:hypothetical protein
VHIHSVAYLAVLAVTVWPPSASAEVNYYFLALNCEGKDPASIALFIMAEESSSVPRKVTCRVVNFDAAQPGNLQELLRCASEQGSRISMWGMYPIKKELFERVVNAPPSGRQELLNLIGPQPAAGLDKAHNLVEAATAGEATCLMVVRRLEPWFLPKGQAPDWIGERLELTRAVSRRHD